VDFPQLDYILYPFLSPEKAFVTEMSQRRNHLAMAAKPEKPSPIPAVDLL
jgi:hypothetical protein